MKRVMKLAAVVMSMMLAVQAEAQLSGLTNSVVPGASDSDASSAVSQEAIVQSYVDANVLVWRAQAKLADAFDLKNDAATARAEADSWQSGSTQPTKKEIEELTVRSTDLLAKVKEKA